MGRGEQHLGVEYTEHRTLRHWLWLWKCPRGHQGSIAAHKSRRDHAVKHMAECEGLPLDDE